MIFQRFSGSVSGTTFSVSGVRYQRKSNMKIPALTKPLTDIETSPFVRVGPTKKNEGGKERKKKVKDIIDGGLKYTETKFSKDFPVRTTLESKLFEKLKDRKIIKEGMTTQVLTGILPSAGNTDLDMLQLGATGSDLSYVDGADSPVDGEFTALVNTDPITSVDDPLDVGTHIRSPQNGASLSLDFTDSDVFHTHSDPGDSVPGDDGGTRGSGISGNHNSGYVNDEGATNENIPFNDFNGEYLPARVGTHLGFGNNTRLANAGFPRYAALKAVDTTEFDTLSMNWFCRGTVNIDTVNGSPTQGEKVVGGSTTKFNTAGDGVSVFYWAGDKEGAATYAPSVTGQSGIHDGWRPINVKPDGTTDNSYSPWLITHKADVATYGSGSRQKHDSGYPAEVLLNNKITLPPWCRDKNTRFLLHQGRNAAGAHRANFGITSVRFQRRSTMKVRSLMKPLSDVETSPFVRVGPTKKNEGGKERKKKVQDIIRSGLKYTGKKFSKDFPVRTDLE